MRILVTRPKEDSISLVAALAELGVESVVEPLLSITYHEKKKVSLEGVQALLITSANGVRAFAHIEKNRDLPVYTVGDASKREAEEVGFEKVTSATGDVEALAKLVTEKLDPHKGTLLHIAGSHVAGDLKGLLEKNEFYYRRAVLYGSEKADALSKETKKTIQSGKIDGVVFYSPRTAEAFVNLVKKARLQKACKNLTAFCLSPAVAKKAEALTWKTLDIADKPEQESLVRRIEQALKTDADTPTQENEAKERDMKTPAKTTPKKDAPKASTAKTEAKGTKKETPSKAEPGTQKGQNKTSPDATASSSSPSSTSSTSASSEVKTPPPPTEKKSGSGLASFLTVLAAIIILGAAAFASAPIWTPKMTAYLPEPVLQILGIAPQSSTAGPQNTNEKTPTTEELIAERDRMKPELDRLLNRVNTLEKALSDVKSMMSAVSSPDAPGGSVAAINSVSERIAKLEEASTDPTKRAEEFKTLAGRVEKLEAERLATAPDLKPTLDALTQRLSDLESVEKRAAESVASAPGMILAVGQLRESLRMQRSFVRELETLKTLTGEDTEAAQAIAILQPLAPKGVKSLTSLRADFDNQAANIVRASITPEGKNWVEKTVSQLASVVSVRRTGDNVTGESTDAIVARTEALLRAGDLAAAVKEIKTLKGPPVETAKSWLTSAEQRLNADQALSTLYARAIALVATTSK
ncbi:MAG: uroporphyrinogen-III synthase [Rhodospirillales bacterium]|nr:uroporphyrinogen-III synthase [Rhodospirillales bacterium]